MINRTLPNLPTYYLTLFPVPIGVLKKLESIFKKFLWGNYGEEEIPFGKLEKVMPTHLKYGGLGAKKLECFNEALLGKWLWKFKLDKNALWRKVVETKYGLGRGGWPSYEVRGPFKVRLWKTIRES